MVVLVCTHLGKLGFFFFPWIRETWCECFNTSQQKILLSKNSYFLVWWSFSRGVVVVTMMMIWEGKVCLVRMKAAAHVLVREVIKDILAALVRRCFAGVFVVTVGRWVGGLGFDRCCCSQLLRFCGDVAHRPGQRASNSLSAGNKARDARAGTWPASLTLSLYPCLIFCNACWLACWVCACVLQNSSWKGKLFPFMMREVV